MDDGDDKHELGEEITLEIIELVRNEIEASGTGYETAVEPVLRGIACAYAAIVAGLHQQDYARELLLFLADHVDDVDALRWADFYGPQSTTDIN